MKTLSIALPDELKIFVDAQTQARGESSPDTYLGELIRHEQQRQNLRHLVLAGDASPVAGEADDAYFAGLRARVTRPSRA